MSVKMTLPAIQARKHGPKITMVTAYDAPSAQIVDRAGVDMILVGDTVAMTVLGYDTTLPATIDIMLHHTAAVTRTRPNALVIADLPWLSYHITTTETIHNAGRLIREGRAEAVKLEGGQKRIPMIEALLSAEIPVMGHIGLTPQSVNIMGGYRVQGKDTETAKALIADAKALAQAGIFALVLEGIPDTIARVITQEIDIPTIGIGAGPDCDGQVLVFHDLLGLYGKHKPKFVREYAHLADLATEAIQQYCIDVQASTFPSDAETYHSSKEVLQARLTSEDNLAMSED